MKTLRALREGRNTNPAHKDAVNSLINHKKGPIYGENIDVEV